MGEYHKMECGRVEGKGNYCETRVWEKDDKKKIGK